MYPILYRSDETNFLHNGLGLLTGTISAVTTEELNGMFELNIQYDNEGFLADVIKEEMIIKAKANDKQDEQLFRIYSITKNHENDNLIIDAQHITYDLANNFVEKLEANNLTKKQVMELIGASAVYPHPFNVTSSNTTTQSSTSLYRTNPLQMVGGMEGSVLQIWGGQIERDNFRLVMHDRRGSDDGTLVTYKKNLTGLTAKFDISNLVTRIFPYKFIEATDDEPEQLITVPGKYIDSPHINDYEMPYILPVDFSNEEGIETAEDLLNAASGWFVETGRDKPKVEMEVQFEHLWETEEYKDVAALEFVGMGDTVTIEHSKLKVEGTAIVNRIEYDAIAKKNLSVEVGNVKAKFTDKVNDANKIIVDIDDKIKNINEKANEAIDSADGKNKIYYGPDQPIGDLREGDLWFKVVDGIYTETYRYDGIQWQLIVSAAVKDIEETANEARNRANEAVERANLATDNATEAIEEAQTAFDEAQNALDLADTAKQASESAGRIASEAAELSNTARTNAEKAMSDAQSALTGIDNLQTTVNVELQNINGELSRKVSQTTFDGLQGIVSNHSTQISQNTTDITSKADKSYVDTVKGTVDSHSTLISQNAEEIQSKASQSSVNTLTGQVEAHESLISQNAREIKSKMSSIDANAKFATQSQLTQTSNSLSSEIASVQGDIDDLEIGGRNLLFGTKDFSSPWVITGGTLFEIDGWTWIESGYQWSVRQELQHKFELGKTYTASVECRNDGTVPIVARIQVALWDELGNRLPSGEEMRLYKTIRAGETKRISVTYLVEKEISKATFYLLTETGYSTYAKFSLAKLEKGNKTTDWTPAPEDIQHQFSSINQTVSEITTRVGNSEGDISSLQQTSSSLATRIDNAEGNISSLTQTAKGLQTQVNDNKGNISTITQLANALQSRMSDAEGNINTLTQTSSSLQSSITSVRNDVDNMEIGVRNLLRNTSTSVTTVTTGGWGDVRLPDGEGQNLLSDGVLQKNETYTLRVYLETGDYPVCCQIRIPNSSQPYRDFRGNDVPSNSKGYSTVTFTVPNDAIDNVQVMVIRFRQHTTPSHQVRYSKVKLEKGNKATDWTPAPEDLATQSQISQLADNINLRVMKGDVINQINIDTSGVLLSGKKLILDGDTTVKGTFRVGNANISELNAGKITAGTLDVGKLSVIGLTANSIVGGILQSQNGTTTFNLNNGNLSMGSATLTFGGTGNNFNGRVDYSEEAFRFQRDPYTYLMINRGGTTGGDGVSSRRNLFAMMAKGTNMIRFGMSDDGIDHTMITGGNVAIKMLAGSLRQVQFRHYGDNDYAGIRAQDIEAMGNITATRNITFQNQLIATENSHLYIRPHVSSGNEVRIADSAGRYHPLRAASFPTGSLAEYKDDITIWNESALEVINQSTIYQYRLKGTEKLRYGLVIGEGYNTPQHVIDGDGVEQYAMNSISWKGLQELDSKLETELDRLRKQNEELILKVAKLEARINYLEVA